MDRSPRVALLFACLLPACSAGEQGNAVDGSRSTQATGSIAPDGGQQDFGPCSPSTDYFKCDGNNALTCACTKQGASEGTGLTGSPIYACDAYSWILASVCAVACDTDINPTSGCIASTEPLPECAQDGLTCWNGNLTVCLNGYALPTTPCATGTQCTLVPGCQALCLPPEATTDPRCPALPGLSNDFCADNTAYHCACGYLTGTQACGAAPNDCKTVSSYDSYDQASGPLALCGLPP